MDYGDILKRAWRVTWRYRALWVLGLFAGVAGGSSGGGGGTGWRSGATNTGNGSNQFSLYQWNLFTSYLREHLVAIVLVIALLALFGLIMWVVGIAARGGLVHLVNEAEENREVRLGAGWSAGFRNWGRVFGVEFLTALPMIVFSLVLVGFFALVVTSAVSRGVPAGDFNTAIAGIAVTGVCFLLIFGVLALIVGTILGIVAQVAIRYVVIQDYRVLGSIAQGWRDLWSRRGAFLMYLVTVGVSIAFSIVAGVLVAIFVVPAVFLFIARAWLAGAGMIGLAVLVMILPTAIYATFHSSMWTVFFRRMTGLQPAPAVAAPIYAPPFPAPAPAPGPYASPEPPAPPMPPSDTGPADA